MVSLRGTFRALALVALFWAPSPSHALNLRPMMKALGDDSPLGIPNHQQGGIKPPPSTDPIQQRIDTYYAEGSFPKAGRSLRQKIDEAKAFLKTEIPKTGAIGVGVSVVYKDQVVISEGYGKRHSNDSSSAVSKDSLFQIGSFTKTFVALAIGLLVEDGKVQWDDTVKQHMPWFQLKDKYAENDVTVGNLLSMNSGFWRTPDTAAYAGAYNSSRALIEALGECESDVPLRKTPAYSNTNYGILGQLIEEVSGKTWYDFVSDRILKPMGMTNTFASIDDVPAALRAKALNAGHNVCKGQVLGPIDTSAREVVLTPTVPQYAPGSMVSSASDVAAVLRLILNKGKVGSATLFQSALTIATMITGKNVATVDVLDFLGEDGSSDGLHFAPDGATLAAGYGFDIVGHLAWGHAYFDKGGDTFVHHTLTGFVPNEALGVAILSNSDTTAQLSQCRGYLMGFFLDVPKEILDFEFKKWRNATDQPAPPVVPGAPACGLDFWTDPPRLPLSPTEVDTLVGEYTALQSSGYMPKLTISRTTEPDEFEFTLGLLTGSFVYASNVEAGKVFVAVGAHPGALATAVVASDGAQPPSFVVQVLNVLYAKQ